MSPQAVASPNQGVTLANVGVINHLLFHKALIGEDDDNTRINRYLSLVKEGEHVSLKDEFDRSIALVFELVIQKQLDVWDIDLVQFSQLYLKRAREEKIDLVTAGRIILMAWTVLKLQSDDLVRKFEARQQETMDIDWTDIQDGWNMEGDELDFTERVRAVRQPIDEKIWHEGDRPVTLMELVTAFETARDEAEKRMVLTTERERYKDFLKKEGALRFKGRVHKEDLEEDLRIIWDRICRFNGTAIPLSDLYAREDVWDFVTAFNSVLFLHRDRKIELWQEQFPHGPVLLRNLKAPQAPAHSEEPAAAPAAEPANPVEAEPQ